MNPPNSFNPVVVAPSYNNARTVADVLRRVRALDLPLIVVNDGSTDATATILTDLAKSDPGVTVVTHPQNRGKATALHTGFAAARDRGFTHAATIDTDGQLDPEQLPQLLSVARETPSAFVLGVRDDTKADYPTKSRVGRRVSNFLVWLESGARVSDSQCGFRVYPLDFVATVHARAGHFGFETEIITRAGWADTPLREVTVNCVYLPPGQRVSHFRPWKDSLRAVVMHHRLVFRALNPWPHPKWPAPAVPDTRPWYRKLVDWLNPMRAWRDLRDEQVGRTSLAIGLAVGVFIANLPLIPIQTLVALFVAKRLHLHPLPVVVGSQASTPPVGFALITAAIAVGQFVLHGQLQWPSLENRSVPELFTSFALSWLIGGLILGLAMGAVTFFAAQTLIRLIPTTPRAPRAPGNPPRKSAATPGTHPAPTTIDRQPANTLP